MLKNRRRIVYKITIKDGKKTMSGYVTSLPMAQAVEEVFKKRYNHPTISITKTKIYMEG